MPRGGRNVPGLQQRFALKGKMLVKYYRGQLVVQAWPKPYGPARSQAQQDTQTAFSRFQRAVKFFPSQHIVAAMKQTANTGMYPRDLLMAAALGTNVQLAYDELGAHQLIGDGIEQMIAAGGETSFDFMNIPTGYQSLWFHWIGRTTQAANTSSLKLTVNGDTSASYDQEIWNRFGQADAYSQTAAVVAGLSGGNAPANYPSIADVWLLGYGNPNFFKPIRGRTDLEEFHSAGGLYASNYSAMWRSLNLISRVTFTVSGAMVKGTTCTLYGLM